MPTENIIKSTGDQKRLTISNVDEYVEKLEPSDNAGGNVKWNNHSLAVSKKLEIPHDPAIPLLYIYSREMKACPHEDYRVPASAQQ